MEGVEFVVVYVSLRGKQHDEALHGDEIKEGSKLSKRHNISHGTETQ
jgi:hypothetical protein